MESTRSYEELAKDLNTRAQEFDKHICTLKQLNDDLVAHFAANECQPIEDAETDVRNILDDYGLSDWDIEISPGGPGRSCASFGLDIPNQAVYLIPIPPQD